MQSFQARVLAKIAELAEARGAEVSQSPEYLNTGTINLHGAGVIAPAIVVGYDFQTATYTLTLTTGGQRIPSQLGRAGYFDFHQGNAYPTRFWEALAAELDKVFGKPKSARLLAKLDRDRPAARRAVVGEVFKGKA